MFGEEHIDLDQDKGFSQSKLNTGEAFLVINAFLIFRFEYNISCDEIGIITPYSA